MLHASGVSYMVSGPNFEFKKVIRNIFRGNSGCLLVTKWQKLWIYKNVSRIVKIVHSALAHHAMFENMRQIFFLHQTRVTISVSENA